MKATQQYVQFNRYKVLCLYHYLSFDNWVNNCFSCSLRFDGNFISYVTYKSPNWPSALYTGNPFPFNLTFVPFCVSGGTFSFTLPPKVSTVVSPPNKAVYKLMLWVVNKSLPDLLNCGSSGIIKVMYKSPFGPPLTP